jgi:hypothetical protein
MSVLDDRQKTTDYWFAVTLVYAGCDLVTITQKGRAFEFSVLCPKFDYDEYFNEWHAGQLQIADAKAYAQMATRIGHIIRDVKRTGEYINEDFRQMLADYENGETKDGN